MTLLYKHVNIKSKNIPPCLLIAEVNAKAKLKKTNLIGGKNHEEKIIGNPTGTHHGRTVSMKAAFIHGK